MKEVSITKINIYYGGRGNTEDPAIYVINKMIEVLKELRVEVNRYNIYEDKQAIATLPATLKEADGVILATTVEWFGISGYMQQFLDMCWLYADKEELSGKYMLPVVMATTYGERDAEIYLIKAWETLAGIPIPGLVAYVDDLDAFEKNEEYGIIIEKKAESLYRSIRQKTKSLPTSNLAVKANLLKTRTIELTPQERERLSQFVSDETYVKQQKEDIEELSAMFKQMLRDSGEEIEDSDTVSGNGTLNDGYTDYSDTVDFNEDSWEKQDEPEEEDDEIIRAFVKAFQPEPEFTASYAIIISDMDAILHIEVTSERVKCFYAATEEADVILRTTSKVLDNIMSGKVTFQKGFMAGEISAKGNFKTLRMLDDIFQFADV